MSVNERNATEDYSFDVGKRIGVNLGRNVWQHPYPLAMMKALYAIIHEKANPKQAQEVFNDVKNKS